MGASPDEGAPARHVRSPTMKVVIAEDSVLLREALGTLLASRGFEVAACVGDAGALLAACEREAPDLVLVDIRMPPGHTDEGLQAAAHLARTQPHVGVLVLSQYLEPRFASRLLEGRGRGRGYLLKDRVRDVDALVEAMRRVADGGTYVDPSVVQQLLSDARTLGELSGRELEILALISEGRSNSAICDRLHLSKKTVETHVRSIFRKLDLQPADDDHRRVLAVVAYLRSARLPAPSRAT